MHVTAGLHNEFAEQLTPTLEMVLKGIKKDKAAATPRIRLPVTLEIMERLRGTFIKKPTDYDNIMMWAAYSLAFFGFLRCSEFTVPSQEEYSSAVHLSLHDISLDSRESPTRIQVRIKQSKTDPFRQGCNLCPGKDICPISAILPYLAKRGARYGPLFITADWTYLTRGIFASRLADALQEAGIDGKGYNTHSFRIGAATTANEKGISDVNIKMLGRWRSNAYQQYVRTPQEQLANLSKQLVS